jgi:hypothetical protein
MEMIVVHHRKPCSPFALGQIRVPKPDLEKACTEEMNRTFGLSSPQGICRDVSVWFLRLMMEAVIPSIAIPTFLKGILGRKDCRRIIRLTSISHPHRLSPPKSSTGKQSIYEDDVIG